MLKSHEISNNQSSFGNKFRYIQGRRPQRLPASYHLASWSKVAADWLPYDGGGNCRHWKTVVDVWEKIGVISAKDAKVRPFFMKVENKQAGKTTRRKLEENLIWIWNKSFELSWQQCISVVVVQIDLKTSGIKNSAVLLSKTKVSTLAYNQNIWNGTQPWALRLRESRPRLWKWFKKVC